MSGRIPTGPAKVLAAMLLASASLAVGAGTANAGTAVVYDNFNTVASEVKGHPNEDTYSYDSEYFPFGGMVEFSRRPGKLKSLTTQVDSFTCEHGVYSLENCLTLHPTKKFSYEMTASIYEVGPHNEALGSPIATSTERFKIPYRPSTIVSCPATEEGRGFGVNCDVGGYLATIKFKRFTPAAVVLPERAIILIASAAGNSPSDIVNVGVQASYKEYKGEFIEEPALDEGVPALGADPLPEALFLKGVLEESPEFKGFQPVFEVIAAQ